MPEVKPVEFDETPGSREKNELYDQCDHAGLEFAFRAITPGFLDTLPICRLGKVMTLAPRQRQLVA